MPIPQNPALALRLKEFLAADFVAAAVRSPAGLNARFPGRRTPESVASVLYHLIEIDAIRRRTHATKESDWDRQFDPESITVSDFLDLFPRENLCRVPGTGKVSIEWLRVYLTIFGLKFSDEVPQKPSRDRAPLSADALAVLKNLGT